MIFKLSALGSLLKKATMTKITSTQTNCDRVEFKFSSEWTGYSKTAVFYSDSTETKLLLLDSENSCVIPWENLINEGVLYIGVFGTKEGSTITSNFVTIDIVQGSNIEGTTPGPNTEDVYAQIISKLAELTSSEITRVQNETTRVQDEDVRQFTYSQNLIDEAQRKADELLRISAELVRVNQEITRIAYYDAYQVHETYSNTNDYVIGNKVTSQGGTYLCRVNTIGNAPTYNMDNTWWKCLAAKGTDGAGGDMFKYMYDSTNKNLDFYQYTDTKVEPLIPESTNKTLYVSVSGSNTSGNGTQANPYKTITFALSKINKTLATDTKIRILAGDYTSEGNIGIMNFSKQYIIVTAFDGTNDIETPNDDYKIYKFGIDSCDKVRLQGFNIMWDGNGDYGIFTTNTRFGYYKGLKNTVGSQINNGFGVTVNSNVLIENCLIANKDVVVSCNFSSKVVAKNFNELSTNNNMGLWAHGGSIISRVGNQFAASYPIVVDDGGLVFSGFGIIETQGNTKYQTTQTITTSPDEIVIPVSLIGVPKEIKINGIVDGGKCLSFGSWVNGVSSCLVRRHTDVTYLNEPVILELDDGTGNYNIYSVSSVTKEAITLSRNTGYTEMVGKTMKLQVICSC